ncbi:large conductance mechanosensitive channel [Asanoa hainanensis]|uniref:Large-conductance mechanosensitive channel n=1 Tax=Asanoa hainanensis TaxID=560556 RepID=A0A239MPA1_9ACTN|nr:large conductance mechanosensitive channel protein MscL [Asanoa hainanensis]SNT44073.1 large conductance mechanosensitive channel [Asanoa hainanensis]
MLKGFKDFIMRGNVVDLAVGVVIGAAFTGVVTQFTKSFLEPLLKLIGAGANRVGGRNEISANNYVEWGAFINVLITFLLTAAALYFLVIFPMNKLAERRRRGEEPPPAAPSEEIKLLTEIRDALIAGGRVPGQYRSALDQTVGRENPPTSR